VEGNEVLIGETFKEVGSFNEKFELLRGGVVKLLADKD